MARYTVKNFNTKVEIDLALSEFASRLKEVKAVIGTISENDVDYCMGLVQDRVKDKLKEK